MACYNQIDTTPISVDILSFLYDRKRIYKRLKGDILSLNGSLILYHTADEQFRAKLQAQLPVLKSMDLVQQLPAGREGEVCIQLTSKGLALLQAVSENALIPEKKDVLDPLDINIVSAHLRRDPSSTVKLKAENARDYWESVPLTVFATIGDQEVLHPVAKADLLVLDAEAALYDGNLSLKELFDAHAQARDHLEAICDVSYDSDFPTHCYELAEHIGIPEAIGRNIVIINELSVIPGLIGKGVGRRTVTKLLRRYGRGGGIVIMPVAMTTPISPHQDTTAAVQRISRKYLEHGFKKHPRLSSYFVGDINVCAGLAADHN